MAGKAGRFQLRAFELDYRSPTPPSGDVQALRFGCGGKRSNPAMHDRTISSLLGKDEETEPWIKNDFKVSPEVLLSGTTARLAAPFGSGLGTGTSPKLRSPPSFSVRTFAPHDLRSSGKRYRRSFHLEPFVGGNAFKRDRARARSATTSRFNIAPPGHLEPDSLLVYHEQATCSGMPAPEQVVPKRAGKEMGRSRQPARNPHSSVQRTLGGAGGLKA